MNKNSTDKSTYYYSKAIYYNNRLDEVINLLDGYASVLSAKLSNASCLLDNKSSLYNGIDLYIYLIKKEIERCNDAINSMKEISISKALTKDLLSDNNEFGGEQNE